MIVMILRAECVHPQEPFPSAAHVFLKCCMGDKFYKGEFWGCHVLLFIMDRIYLRVSKHQLDAAFALDNVEGGCMIASLSHSRTWMGIHIPSAPWEYSHLF